MLVVRLRLGVELDGAPPLPARAAPGVRPALELDSRTVGKQLERLPEVDALDLLDELEEVAALVAPMAIPDLTLRVHREGRGLLRVEGTEPRQLAASAMERDVPTDHLDQIEARLDLRDGIPSHGPPAQTAA